MNNRTGTKLTIAFIFVALLFFAINGLTLSADSKDKKASSFTLPKNIVSLSKANTHPNITEDIEVIEPSETTKELLSESKITIENPELIKLLNETMIRPSPIAVGYRASIYLGRWPLRYESKETSVLWDYQKINENKLSNSSGTEVEEIRYMQKEKKEIKGALTNKVANAEVIRKMMLQKAVKKTNLPLSFTTIIGQNTKLENFYHVPAKKTGYLHAYTPAINEKGQVTVGEVSLVLKGNTKKLQINNVTKQGIGAWIPIQDHVALSFQIK